MGDTVLKFPDHMPGGLNSPASVLPQVAKEALANEPFF